MPPSCVASSMGRSSLRATGRLDATSLEQAVDKLTAVGGRVLGVIWNGALATEPGTYDYLYRGSEKPIRNTLSSGPPRERRWAVGSRPTPQRQGRCRCDCSSLT